MADINKNVEINFISNASQVKSQVDDLLGSLDKNSQEYEELTVAARGLADAEYKLISAQKALANSTDHTEGAMASMQKRLREAESGYTNQANSVGRLTTRLSDNRNAINNHTVSTNSNRKAIIDNGGAMGLFSELTGGLAMTFKDASEATAGFGVSLKGLKGALIATGIGLLVIAVGELVANWDKVKGAIDGSTEALRRHQVQQQILNMLQAQFETSVKRELALATARGAGDEETLRIMVKNRERTFKFLQEKYDNEYKLYLSNGDRSLEAQQKINDANQELMNSQADYDLQIEVLRATIQKTKADERAKAAEEAQKARLEAEKKAAEDRIKAAEEEAARIKKINSDTFEFLEKLSDGKIAYEKGIKDQEEAERIEREKANEEALKKADDEETARRQKIKDDKEAKKKIEEEEATATKEITGRTSSVLDQAAGLAGEHTAAGKTLAVASTTISTYQSATDAYKGMVSAIPGPVGIAAGVAAAAVSVAAGLANVKKILSVKVPSKKGGGGGVPGGGGGAGGAAVAQPSVAFVASSENQIAQGVARQQASQEPIKAYVVSSEVTTAQQLDRNLVQSTSI